MCIPPLCLVKRCARLRGYRAPRLILILHVSTCRRALANSPPLSLSALSLSLALVFLGPRVRHSACAREIQNFSLRCLPFLHLDVSIRLLSPSSSLSAASPLCFLYFSSPRSGVAVTRRAQTCWIAESSQSPPRRRTKVHTSSDSTGTRGLPLTIASASPAGGPRRVT